MKRLQFSLVLLLGLGLMLATSSRLLAATLTATPNPAQTGTSVAIEVRSPCSATVAIPACPLTVDFKDGTTQVFSAPSVDLSAVTLCFGTIAIYNANHTYSAPGNYNVTASKPGGLNCGVADSGSLSLQVTCPALTLSPQTLPAGKLGVAYGATLVVSGGSGARSVSPTPVEGTLPPGLTLSPSGSFSGTPTQTGTFTFMVRATDSCPQGAQIAQQVYSIQVGCAPLTVTTSTFPPATVGAPYSAGYAASGGVPPYTFPALFDAPPPGLSYVGATGTFSGTPTAAGSFPLPVTAVDSCPLGAQTSPAKTVTLTVNPATAVCTSPNFITATTLPNGTAGLGYATQLTAAGTPAPLTFVLTGGALPPGLSLATNGALVGTPTSAGSYSFTVRVTNSCTSAPQTAEAGFAVTIAPASQPGGMTVTVSPPFFQAALGTATTLPLTYQFNGVGSANLSSSGGVFMANGELLGTNPAPLAVRVQDGRGSVSETVVIPPRIAALARERGGNRYTYERTFADPERGTTLSTMVNVALTTEAAAGFEIKRLQLSFDRKMGSIETTVHRNASNLRAYAELRYVGSGLLQGYWEVDGVSRYPVFQNLSYGPAVVIESPAVPSLPTLNPGSHLVRLVVTQPAIGFDLPVIVYAVLPDQGDVVLESLQLEAPANDEILDFTPPTLRWHKLATEGTYEIVFLAAPDGKPIFTAYAVEPSYTIAKESFNRIFAPGKSYWWQVRLLKQGKPVTESGFGWFRFKER